MPINQSVGAEGVNRSADVLTVQRLLNRRVNELGVARLAEDGRLGPRTLAAIEGFQRNIVKLTRPDSRVDVNGPTILALETDASAGPPSLGGDPAWMSIAQHEKSLNVREVAGFGRDQNHPRILQYLSLFPGLRTKMAKGAPKGITMAMADETPWCAAFVNWCLTRAGKAAGSSMAENWERYGDLETKDSPRVGAIAVTRKMPVKSKYGGMTSGFHVGFYVRGPANRPWLLGGNQND